MHLSPPMLKIKPVYYLLISSTVWSWMCLFRWKAWGSPVLPHCVSPNSSKWTFSSHSFSTDWPWILFATMALGMGFDSPWVGTILIYSFWSSPNYGRCFSKKVEEMGSLLHQNFTLIILVQILNKCNPLWQISVTTPESCAAFCLNTFVWAFVWEMQLLWKPLPEMTVIALNYVLSSVQLF